MNTRGARHLCSPRPCYLLEPPHIFLPLRNVHSGATLSYKYRDLIGWRHHQLDILHLSHCLLTTLYFKNPPHKDMPLDKVSASNPWHPLRILF
jgi:hypothetical protein